MYVPISDPRVAYGLSGSARYLWVPINSTSALKVSHPRAAVAGISPTSS